MNRVTFSVVAIMLLAAATTLPFVLNAGFGKAPQGAQLSQVEASPHYRDGQFHNQLPTPGFTGQKNMLAAWWDFLMTKRENARPAQPLPLVKTDLATLPLGQDVMVWLGHSSWYLQLAGKRILIDPGSAITRRRSPLSIKPSPATIRGGRKGCRRSIC